MFGTWRTPDHIRVPGKLQMPWLIDPQTGKVRADLAAHYELNA